MLVICASKSDIGYNTGNSDWVIISETHPHFDRLKNLGFEPREPDYLEQIMFENGEFELFYENFEGCGHPKHFPDGKVRGSHTHYCPKCKNGLKVQEGI